MKKMITALLIVMLILINGCSNITENSDDKTETEIVENRVEETYEKGELQNTIYGEIKGYTNNEENVLVWKGIPYAKARRWSAPVKPALFEEVFDATEAGNVAIQTENNDIIGSEESLNLDIYRPNTDENNLPVLFFIHGGNNQSGTAQEMTGDSFVNELDAIFVSINYRLGPLGFNPLPALNTGDPLEDSGNYALLDIAAALDWVNQNISQFGGDPNNITISGFSAGGRDVMATLVSPLFEGKFQKAIAFSGGMTIADKEFSINKFADAFASLVVEDGVKDTHEEAYNWLKEDTEEVKSYLFSLPADRIVRLMNNAAIRMSSFPHLYNDGQVIPEESFESSDYNDVPLMMLTGLNEFSFFALGDPYFAPSVEDQTLFTDEEMINGFAFAERYGSTLYKNFNTHDSAEKLYDNYDASIYTVEIPFGKNLEATTDMDLFGSFHGVFVPLLDSNNKTYLSMITESYELEGAKDLRSTFRKYLSNFLHSGNPNDESLFQWDEWTKKSPANLSLNANADEVIVKMEERRTTSSEIITQIEEDTTLAPDIKKIIISEVLNGRWFSEELDQYFENKSLWIE